MWQSSEMKFSERGPAKSTLYDNDWVRIKDNTLCALCHVWPVSFIIHRDKVHEQNIFSSRIHPGDLYLKGWEHPPAVSEHVGKHHYRCQRINKWNTRQGDGKYKWCHESLGLSRYLCLGSDDWYRFCLCRFFCCYLSLLLLFFVFFSVLPMKQQNIYLLHSWNEHKLNLRNEQKQPIIWICLTWKRLFWKITLLKAILAWLFCVRNSSHLLLQISGWVCELLFGPTANYLHDTVS